MVKAVGVTAGTMFVAIGLSAMLGGADLFSPPTPGDNVSQAAPPTQAPSPQASPSARPSPPVEAMTAAGTIYAPWQGGGTKKHHKG
jgi:hypothetical protein